LLLSEIEPDENGRGYAARQCLAHHLRRLRLERGWSQLQLAEAAGLHRTHVSRLENSAYNASIDTVENIAGAFGVRSWTLLEPPALAEPG
jgi:transcriptional regulator with XRE-family HTH domain